VTDLTDTEKAMLAFTHSAQGALRHRGHLQMAQMNHAVTGTERIEQLAALTTKAEVQPATFWVMTATPIPRTVAMPRRRPALAAGLEGRPRQEVRRYRALVRLAACLMEPSLPVRTLHW